MGWDGVERRRQGADWQVQLLRLLALASWLLYIVALLLFHYARPEMDSGIARYYGVEIRHHWDPFYSNSLLYVVWCSCLFSLLSLFLGVKRSRRSSDNRRYNLTLLVLVTLASGILFTYKIGLG